MNHPPIIVGAGLAGLIAACHFKDSQIIDAGSKGQNHQALLRFRSTAVSELTGIPFKKVEVQKEIAIDGATSNYCTIAAANAYSMKVSGGLSSRSIRNLAPEVRYIAPDDFYDQLVERHADRINWQTPFNRAIMEAPPQGVNWISTAPMSVNMEVAGIDKAHAEFNFKKSGITAIRVPFVVPADIYQTIYFPNPSDRLFRASITGNVLILELVDGADSIISSDFASNENDEWDAIELACYVMGLDARRVLDCEARTVSVQKFGKIVDMPKEQRHAVMYELTSRHNIFSLGRFATWRNILLDDVVQDIQAISGLMQASDYSRHLSFMGSKK